MGHLVYKLFVTKYTFNWCASLKENRMVKAYFAILAMAVACCAANRGEFFAKFGRSSGGMEIKKETIQGLSAIGEATSRSSSCAISSVPCSCASALGICTCDAIDGCVCTSGTCSISTSAGTTTTTTTSTSTTTVSCSNCICTTTVCTTTVDTVCSATVTGTACTTTTGGGGGGGG
ncbi:Uncharacterized protein APZ42_018063, partial [Daphnia magna]